MSVRPSIVTFEHSISKSLKNAFMNFFFKFCRKILVDQLEKVPVLAKLQIFSNEKSCLEPALFSLEPQNIAEKEI